MASSSRSLPILLGIIATVLVGWVLYAGAGILQPLVIAVLLATMLQPVVSTLARWKIPPALTVVLMVSLLFVGIAQLGFILQESLQSFVEPPPGSDLVGWQGMLAGTAERLKHSALPEDVVDLINEFLQGLDIRGVAAGAIGTGFGFMKSLVLVMLYMIFIFAEQAGFRRKLLQVAGGRQDDAAFVLDNITSGIQRYLGVKTLVSLLTGTLGYLLLISLGVPFALLFGMLTFLLNYIPTFGSIIAGAFPTLIALAVEPTWTTAMIVAGGFLLINFLLGNIIEPKVLGRELNLSPLIIIISVVVWGSLWGILGAFLAVPLTSAGTIILASQKRTRPIAVMLSSGLPRVPVRRR